MRTLRIGILTFHRSFNYGAFLQCYSLSYRLQQDLPDCIVNVIDYSYDDNLGYMVAEQKAKGAKREFIVERNQYIKSVVSTLPLFDLGIADKSYSSLYEKIGKEYDLIIVGSDAVFNWNSKSLPNAFMPVDVPKNIILTSYAASAHGVAYLSARNEKKEIICRALTEFSYIGVRDDETARMVKWSGCDNEPVHNCDPTVFLDLNILPVNMHELEHKLEKHGLSMKKPIIGIMAGEPFGRGIKEHFGTDVEIVSVFGYNRYADVNLSDLNPFEWARVFSFFDVTVTHYFHGTMFSLKNNCPTIVTERAVRFRENYSTKLTDLLKRLDIENLYYPMNIKTDSIVDKALLKIGISDYSYRQGLYRKIEDVLSHTASDNCISDKLLEESKNYNGFLSYLKSL